MIPKKAKQVFQGHTFHVYQWEQELYDKSLKTFEVARKLDGVTILATHKNKLVVLRQKQPNKNWFYSLPSGYMDIAGELPRQTALRELMEETGMKPQSIKLWKKFSHGGRIISHHYVFIARNCSVIKEQQLDGGEIIKVELCDFKDMIELVGRPDFHNSDIALEIYKAQAIPEYGKLLKTALFGS